ncbi:XkdX family protein [Lactobacillus helveticus]|uniref:XkdX family protein n=1 Tax=Lactobacillus helveticus TaxID=1587 RepID=UPI001A0C4332|nr:XkdX family protein [Lactobacillus helveticus]NRO27690.1 hypothetical protein [Lactobacillus helveticus]
MMADGTIFYSKELEQCFFNMYKMDWDFWWYNKDKMKSLVAQKSLSAEKYQKIVGEDYEASKVTAN